MTVQQHRMIAPDPSAPAIAGTAASRQIQGSALNSLGSRFAARGESQRAIACYAQALEIARETGDRGGQGVTLANLGNRYAALGEARRAIAFYEQALRIAREIGDGEGAGEALGGLSQAYTALGEPRRAMALYDQALGIAREIGGRRKEAPGNATPNPPHQRRVRPGRRRPVARHALSTWRKELRPMAAAAMLIVAVTMASVIGLVGSGTESRHETRKAIVEPAIRVAAAPASSPVSAGPVPAPATVPVTTPPSGQGIGQETASPPATVTAASPDVAAENADPLGPTSGDGAAAREFAALVEPASPAERVPPAPPRAPAQDPAIRPAERWTGEAREPLATSGLADAGSDFPTSRRGDRNADPGRQPLAQDSGRRTVAAVNPDRLVPVRARSSRVSPGEVQSNRTQLVKSGLLYGASDAVARRRRQTAEAVESGRFVPANQLAALGVSDVPLGPSRRVQTAQTEGQQVEEDDESRLSDEPYPFLGEGDIPDRAPLLLEIGDPFLDTGELDQGFELPTGAVWQPRLWVFGTQRSAIQTIDTGDEDRISDWANRLDLFANLQLTGTEKIVAGIRPWDENQPNDFSGYRFEPTEGKGFRNNVNADIRTLFAEGDFGSLFPALDPEGTTLLDFGFTVGRQPIIFQDGILISDTQDTVGLVRNNVRLPGVSNLRIAGIYSSDLFDETTRSAGGIPAVDNENLELTGLFTEWDTRYTTINADAIYAWDDTPDGDGFYAGISAAQRIGELNTTFRVNGSLAEDDETLLVRDGILVSSELSWTPYGTNDTAYFNPFVAFGEFLQAAREEVDGGGPLAPLGILFASPNIGEFGSELSNRANDVVGAAIGYQAFWDDNRRNLAVEIAARHDLGLDDGAQIVTPEGLIISFDGFDQYGAGFQFQQAIGQRAIIQLEGFGALQEDRNDTYGGRLEFLYQF